jgi:acetyl-CoA synthetase
MSSKKSAKKKTAKKPATEEAYKPSKEFSSKARIKSMAQYKKMYKESIDAPAKFWAKEASELTWQKKWTKVLDWKVPYAKWFVGGKINVCENCVDRHADGPRKNKAAIIFEGEPGDRTVLTYKPSSSARSASSPTCSRPTASSPRTAWPSTCR